MITIQEVILTNVVSICQDHTKFFTLAEVNKLVPLLDRITRRHEREIQKAMSNQRFLIKTGAPQSCVSKCDDIVGYHMAEWGKKIYKLGGRVLQGGYIAFDNSWGYWSWHWGEHEINMYHDYTESPNQRRNVGIILTGKK